MVHHMVGVTINTKNKYWLAVVVNLNLIRNPMPFCVSSSHRPYNIKKSSHDVMYVLALARSRFSFSFLNNLPYEYVHVSCIPT